MKNSNKMNILDLPNEILLIIFEKLKTVDILYSLVDVHHRFNKIVFDLIDMRDVNFVRTMDMYSFHDCNYSIDTKIISTLCHQILFRIADKIRQLTIEHNSMDQILSCCTYPQLDTLTLVNCDEDKLYEDLQKDERLRNLLAKQIKCLHIDIKANQLASDRVHQICGLIMCLCQNLNVFNFCNTSVVRTCCTMLFRCRSLTSDIYSTLVKLKIKVFSLYDCIYVLDAPFERLQTLIVDVERFFRTGTSHESLKTTPKVKCFSLSCSEWVGFYNVLLVPFLRRLIFVEELQLYLNVLRSNSYIDGIQLWDEILCYMTHLKKFTFNIRSEIANHNVTTDIQSIEDIQRSFIGKGYQQVVSDIRENPNTKTSQCHIYSLPYDFDYFLGLDNDFQGGNFDKVRFLTIRDIFPLKQRILQIICQSFPVVEYLSITNRNPLEEKQQPLTLFEFPCLTTLDILDAHIDYAEKFLLKKNAHLPHLLNLRVKYASLIEITNNFTIDATLFNFQTLQSLDVCQSFIPSHNFHEYFPLL